MNDIILTGPKHSGKTSAGRILASLCSCVFIDLDELITQKTGKSPRQLYIEGASVFQMAEAQAITDCISASGQERRVIAAGGGIIDNQDAIDIIKKAGSTTVFLRISAETAWQRISGKGELPPFLQTDNPQETHRVLHERRAAAYLQFTNIVIEAEEKTSEEIAKEIYLKTTG